MIHGRVKLDFCDAITGKVKDRIEGDNTFTNAIDSLLNKCPFGWDRATMDGTKTRFESQLTFARSALGGVILFPDDVTAGANALYEPVSNQPTAYSAYGAQDTSDSKTGSYNIIESIDIPNGFRFVHEWGASYGNGTIKAVCLTNQYGGQAYLKKTYWQHKFLLSSSLYSGSTMGIPLGMCDGYIYYILSGNTEYMTTNGSIVRVKRPINEMLVNQLMLKEGEPETIWTNNTNQVPRVGLDSVNKKIYILYGETGSNKTLATIDVTTSPFTPSTQTLSNTADVVKNVGSNTFIARRGNYLYFYSFKDAYTDNGTIEKINLNNNADYDEISIPHNCSRYANLFYMPDTGDISGGEFYLDENDDIHYMDNSNSTAIFQMERYGVWRAVGNEGKLGLTIDPYYMASKFTLDSAVTKTSSLTMKLVYEVTHS